MNRRGTSLVELVVAIALVATMTMSIGAMSGMVASSNAAMEKSTLKMSKANVALETIVEGIKGASALSTSSGGKACFSIIGGGSGIQFKGSNGKTQQISQSGQQIIHTMDMSLPGTTQVVADEVKTLSFSKASDSRVVVKITTIGSTTASASSGKALSGSVSDTGNDYNVPGEADQSTLETAVYAQNAFTARATVN